MLSSMTGYGQSEAKVRDHNIKVEVRTLNSKFIDLNVRLPKELLAHENSIRTLCQERLKRGKVNISLELETDTDGTTEIDEELLKVYFQIYFHINSNKEKSTYFNNTEKCKISTVYSKQLLISLKRNFF